MGKFTKACFQNVFFVRQHYFISTGLKPGANESIAGLEDFENTP
jgi:hypothetical protein